MKKGLRTSVTTVSEYYMNRSYLGYHMQGLKGLYDFGNLQIFEISNMEKSSDFYDLQIEVSKLVESIITQNLPSYKICILENYICEQVTDEIYKFKDLLVYNVNSKIVQVKASHKILERDIQFPSYRCETRNMLPKHTRSLGMK